MRIEGMILSTMDVPSEPLTPSKATLLQHKYVNLLDLPSPLILSIKALDMLSSIGIKQSI